MKNTSSSIGMALALYSIPAVFSPGGRLVSLAFFISTGTLVYLLLAWVLKSGELHFLAESYRKKKTPLRSEAHT
jgi:hypothetical protein